MAHREERFATNVAERFFYIKSIRSNSNYLLNTAGKNLKKYLQLKYKGDKIVKIYM